jgi:hypothetical protein
MSYTKRTDIPVAAGEAAVELDTGELVAVACTREVRGTSLYFLATARAIDASGNAVTGADDQPVTTQLAMTHTDIASADDMARDCLLAVLGESTTLIQPTPPVQAASIRRALQLAQITTGTVDAGDML